MSAASQAPAYARTGAPITAGPIIVAIARVFGLDLTLDQALFLIPVVSFGYYCLGRALEAYNPKLGYVLGIAKQPAYSKQDAPAPGEGEALVAVVVPDEVADAQGDGGDADEVPVQTDNGPRAEEGERLSTRQGEVFSGEMR